MPQSHQNRLSTALEHSLGLQSLPQSKQLARMCWQVMLCFVCKFEWKLAPALDARFGLQHLCILKSCLLFSACGWLACGGSACRRSATSGARR